MPDEPKSPKTETNQKLTKKVSQFFPRGFTLTLYWVLAIGVLVILALLNKVTNFVEASLTTLFIFPLMGTFAGVFLAEALTRRRERDNENKRDKKIAVGSLKYLFSEIMLNYVTLKRINDTLTAHDPPNKIEAIKYTNPTIQSFESKMYTSFVSSGAAFVFQNDKLDNAVQQIYIQLWYVKQNFQSAVNAFIQPNPQEEAQYGDYFFQLAKDRVRSSLNITEENIQVIIKIMKSYGMTYQVTKGGEEVIDAFEGDNFKKIPDVPPMPEEYKKKIKKD